MRHFPAVNYNEFWTFGYNILSKSFCSLFAEKSTLENPSFHLKNDDKHKANKLHDIQIPILAIIFHSDDA